MGAGVSSDLWDLWPHSDMASFLLKGKGQKPVPKKTVREAKGTNSTESTETKGISGV